MSILYIPAKAHYSWVINTISSKKEVTKNGAFTGNNNNNNTVEDLHNTNLET